MEWTPEAVQWMVIKIIAGFYIATYVFIWALAMMGFFDSD